MAKSKAINVFLIDGEPTGRIKCTMQNWTGVIYKIPRTMLDKCGAGNHDIVRHLRQTGIYFLLGENETDGRRAVYVGQAVTRKNGSGLFCRLQEHMNHETERYFKDWNEIIVLTTQNDSFGPTEISYLENRFTNLSREAQRYEVRNGNEPNPGNLTEEKESEMLEFMDYARMIIPILGHRVFEPLIQTPPEEETAASPLFTFRGRYTARGMITNEGFVLLKDSEISRTFQPSAPESVAKARKLHEKKVQDFRTRENILFTSPSAAASFVAGGARSGNACWKTDDGKAPNEVHF